MLPGSYHFILSIIFLTTLIKNILYIKLTLQIKFIMFTIMLKVKIVNINISKSLIYIYNKSQQFGPAGRMQTSKPKYAGR